MTPEEMLAASLARIETKLDTALSNVADHEARIRLLEARPTGITPAKLLTSFAGVAAVASAIASFVTIATR